MQLKSVGNQLKLLRFLRKRADKKKKSNFLNSTMNCIKLLCEYFNFNLCVCVQTSSIKLQCRHPQAWKRGGTLQIWVRAPRRPSAHGFVQSNVSIVIFPLPRLLLITSLHASRVAISPFVNTMSFHVVLNTRLLYSPCVPVGPSPPHP